MGGSSKGRRHILEKKTHFLASVSIDPRTKESTLGILKFQKNGFREAPYCTYRSAHDICRLKATIVVPLFLILICVNAARVSAQFLV